MKKITSNPLLEAAGWSAFLEIFPVETKDLQAMFEYKKEMEASRDHFKAFLDEFIDTTLPKIHVRAVNLAKDVVKRSGYGSSSLNVIN